MQYAVTELFQWIHKSTVLSHPSTSLLVNSGNVSSIPSTAIFILTEEVVVVYLYFIYFHF